MTTEKYAEHKNSAFCEKKQLFRNGDRKSFQKLDTPTNYS